MLCPEVWTFPTRPVNTSYLFGNYDKKGRQTVDKLIKSYAFNKMVSIVLPGCETIPQAVQQLINAGDYYLIRNLKLSDLVRRDFIEAFIKRGRLTGISSDVGICTSCENITAITPDGKLILSISKDLYQIIGLEGRPAGLPNRNKEQFEIFIDLKSNEFHEQSKYYNRINNAFLSSKIDVFDFLLSWDSNDSTVCPSSIAKFFHDCGYKVEQHSIQVLTTTGDLKIPNQLFTQGQIDVDLAHAIAEYFGTVMLACDANGSQERISYNPAFDLNLHNEKSTEALVLHCKGLLTADFIKKLMEVSRQSVDSKSVILSVNGYEKVPLMSYKGYTVNLLNNIKYFVYET